MIEHIAFNIAMGCLKMATFCVSARIPGRDFFISIGDSIAAYYEDDYDNTAK
jgi:hypothetical protein